ncbi:MAG: hypothetical protein ACE5HE_09460 [Phycisphaerae bacterium]
METANTPGRDHVAGRSYGEEADTHGSGPEADRDIVVAKASIFADMPPLPKWMLYLASFTAYVTPFYMMRCWWMTFMGRPRDEHVHQHAHELPLMYVPLVVLAVGTVYCSYFLFRPLIADAAPAATSAAMVLATDGTVHTEAINAAHHWLLFSVGGAFIVGFAAALLVYGRGLARPEALKQAIRPAHLVLERKYFLDEIYSFVWVKGCVVVARIARLVDTYIIDMFVDMAAAVTGRLAAFSGLIVDNEGVDGVVNGIAKSTTDMAGVVRTPQTGRIRNYVLFATALAAVAVICVLMFGAEPGGGAAMTGYLTR